MKTISPRRDGADAARKAVPAAHERVLDAADLDRIAAAGGPASGGVGGGGNAAWPPPPGRN
jgi:hypothetical protein